MYRLRQGLAQNFFFEKLIMIVGAAKDKDIEGIFRELHSTALGAPPAHYILTQAPNPRAASPSELRERSRTFLPTRDVSLASDVATALQKAYALAGPHDLICITGSLFVVAEARLHFGLAEASDPIY
jgi:dihydrofolate synthase/folylpolyglutamate synthase